MRPYRTTVLMTVLALTMLVGCRQQDEGSSASESAPDAVADMAFGNAVDVIARDFSFEAPAEIPSGWTTFRFQNQGAQEHFMALTRMPDGITIEDYRNDIVVGAFGGAMGPYYDGEVELGTALENLVGSLPEWYGQVTPAGGAGLVSAGEEAVTTVNLQPGTYILECYVKAPDGRFHVDLGMLEELIVTDAPNGAAEPEADLAIVLTNYTIDAPDTVKAGEHVVRVEVRDNPEGFLKHDVHLVRLSDEVSVDEVAAWMDWIDALTSPAPAEFIGGADQMPAGGTAYVTLDLEPGSYAWISEGYATQGMVKEFVVE